MALAHPQGNNRVYICLRGDDLINPGEQDLLMRLIYDILGAYYIRRMEFEFVFEDGDNASCLELKMSHHITFDDATNIANIIKQSVALCKGEYRKFNSWIDSTEAYG